MDDQETMMRDSLSKLPPALQKTLRRLAFELSRHRYREEQERLAAQALERLKSGAALDDVLAEFEKLAFEAARRNAW